MKGTIVAAAAAVMAGGVSASGHGHHHAHYELFKKGMNESEVCTPGCTTIWTTITGPAGLYTPPPVAVANTTAVVAVVTTSKPTPTSTPATVPTQMAETCATPGVYTFPATTIVVTETEIVCGAKPTTVPSGTHTLGGVTTVVETATTVVCPYATTHSSNGVVTSVIETTTYVCPSAGTYTIGPITTVVEKTTAVVAVPCIETYTPGTYTAPEIVTTVTETDYVFYCPYTAVGLPTTAAAVVATTTSAAAVATTSASTANTALGGGSQWAITYTPYTESGQCKSASEVMTDITSIKAAGFTTVRVYSTDCSTLPNVGAACRSVGLKMIVGIFINEVGCHSSNPDVATQISALQSWAQWDLVELVVVANEAMYNGYCTVSELVALVTEVKTTFGASGYTGPCTTTDVVSAWQDNDVTALCEVIDVVSCNAHAYFNSETTAAQAGPFVAGQLAIVEKICGKKGYVMETGWPYQGNCNGVACASVSEQSQALASIQQSCGGQVVFFTFGLDLWKDAGSCNCEPYFDCKSYFTSLASK